MASGFIYEYDDQDRLTRQFNGTKTIEYLDYVDDLPMQINTTDQFSNTKIQRYFYDDKRNIDAMKYLDAIDDAFYFSDLGYLNSIVGKIWFL